MSARLLICFLRKKNNINTYETYKHIHAEKVFTNADNAWIFSYLSLSCCVFHFYLFAVSFFLLDGVYPYSMWMVFFCVFVFTRRISPTRSHASHEIFPIHIGIRFLNMVWQAGSIMVFQISIKIMQHAHTTNKYNFDLNCQWYGQMMSKWFDKMYKSNADKMFLV